MYLQKVKPEETGLKIGGSYWMYSVSDMGAFFKQQIKITEIREKQEFAQYKNLLYLIYIEKGKRKSAGMLLKSSMLFLESEVPLPIDSDHGSFSINACMNFVTENPEELKQFIKEKNRFKQSRLGIITYSTANSHELKVLFPELADLNHAVISRIMEKENNEV